MSNSLFIFFINTRQHKINYLKLDITHLDDNFSNRKNKYKKKRWEVDFTLVYITLEKSESGCWVFGILLGYVETELA